MKNQRKHYTPEEKVAILRRHLVEGVPISDVCDELGLQPTVFYRWQRTELRLSSSEDGRTISPNRNESPIWSRRSRRKMRFWLN